MCLIVIERFKSSINTTWTIERNTSGNVRFQFKVVISWTLFSHCISRSFFDNSIANDCPSISTFQFWSGVKTTAKSFFKWTAFFSLSLVSKPKGKMGKPVRHLIYTVRCENKWMNVSDRSGRWCFVVQSIKCAISIYCRVISNAAQRFIECFSVFIQWFTWDSDSLKCSRAQKAWNSSLKYWESRGNHSSNRCFDAVMADKSVGYS